MPGGQFIQLNAPDAGDGIVLNDQLVAVGRGCPHVGFGVKLMPGSQPGGHGVVLRAGYVNTLDLLQCLLEFFFDLRLGFAQHIPDDPLPSLGIVPGGIPPLSPPIFALSDVTLAVGPFLCHDDRLLCSNTTYHTFLWIAIPSGQSYQTVINLPGGLALTTAASIKFYSGAEFEGPPIGRTPVSAPDFGAETGTSVNPSVALVRGRRPCGLGRFSSSALWPEPSGRGVDGARWRL